MKTGGERWEEENAKQRERERDREKKEKIKGKNSRRGSRVGWPLSILLARLSAPHINTGIFTYISPLSLYTLLPTGRERNAEPTRPASDSTDSFFVAM